MMDFGAFAAQLLTGIASASALFLVSCGLTIIFGVTRVVNFAHGSFFMLGAYIGITLMNILMPALSPFLGFWLAIFSAALATGLIGVAVEMLLLRRIYHAPELFQVLLTFGVVLVVQDLVVWVWGAHDLIGPRAPGLSGAVEVSGQFFPQYELFMIAVSPLCLGGLWLLFNRTRWGILVRAATDDREMASILGVKQPVLFTSVFFLGAALAGFAGAIQLPREPANINMDVNIIVESFVVTVIGGMGSFAGAYLAALIVGVLHAFGVMLFPKLTLVLIFLVMAAVLIARPHGLLGRPEPASGGSVNAGTLSRPFEWPTLAIVGVLGVLVLLPLFADRYLLKVMIEIFIMAVFAFSLNFIVNIGGSVSFGHAAYFGLGAYGAALAVRYVPMEAALLVAVLAALAGALLFGWFVIRLSGIYLAMLTLAVAQIIWSVAFQWVEVTGGDNGIVGIRPSAWAESRVAFYYLALGLCAATILGIHRLTFAPFGFRTRAVRDSALRAGAIGIDARRQRWLAFSLAGAAAGLSGGLFSFSIGSIDPSVLSMTVSLDGLVTILIGGFQVLVGPVVGALIYTAMKVFLLSTTDHWRLILGILIILLSIACPQGVTGSLSALAGFVERWRKSPHGSRAPTGRRSDA